MGFDFIIIMPLLPSCYGFFVFGCGVSSFGGFQHPLFDGCSTASCNCDALTGGDGCMSVYYFNLNLKPQVKVLRGGTALLYSQKWNICVSDLSDYILYVLFSFAILLNGHNSFSPIASRSQK